MFKELTNLIKKELNKRLAQSPNKETCPYKLGKELADDSSLAKSLAENLAINSKEDIVKAMIEDIRVNGKSSVASQLAMSMGIGGPTSDTMPGAYGEFGKTKTNPIPVEGISSIDSYLKKLSRTDGGKISWNRIGSTGSENINGMIDIYEIFNDSKTLIDTLYICAYCGKTTNRIPSGYKI